MNDLGLPPHRELPAQVRDRMLDKVRADIRRGPRRSVRAPLSIAAAVAVLAGGAFLVTGVPGDDERRAPAVGGAAVLDRCWAAVESAGKAGAYPERDQWRTWFTEPLALTTVTGIRAGGTTLFCETSLTSVSVSAPAPDPTPPEGAAVGVAMSSPNGTVVGFAEPDFARVVVATAKPVTESLGRPAPLSSGDVPVRDGVFVASLAHNDLTGVDLVATAYRKGAEGVRVPVRAPEPLVYEVDRLSREDGRSSEAARRLDDCLTRPGNGGGPVVDAGTWRAGAVFDRYIPGRDEGAKTSMGERKSSVVATNRRATVVCVTEPTWSLWVFPTPDSLTSPDKPIGLVMGENHEPGLSLVGVTGPEVATIELRARQGAKGGDPVTVRVHARTFTAFVPGVEPVYGADGHIGERTVTATAYAADGTVLHEGPLPRIPK